MLPMYELYGMWMHLSEAVKIERKCRAVSETVECCNKVGGLKCWIMSRLGLIGNVRFKKRLEQG